MTTTSGTVNRGSDYNRTTADEAGDRAANLAEKAGEQVDRVVKNVESAARSVTDQGREASERVQVVAENFKTAVDKSVKDQPMTTLLAAAVVGFVIGAIWKS